MSKREEIDPAESKPVTDDEVPTQPADPANVDIENTIELTDEMVDNHASQSKQSDVDKPSAAEFGLTIDNEIKEIIENNTGANHNSSDNLDQEFDFITDELDIINAKKTEKLDPLPEHVFEVDTPSKKPKEKKDKGSPSPPIIIKKIKKHSHGHHGGAWKIAFADFVTAMMAFFLLMWLLASLNKSQKEGVADYFKQPIKVALFGGNSSGDRKESINGGGADVTQRDGQTTANNKSPVAIKKFADSALTKAEEMRQLQSIKNKLTESIDTEPALMGLKKQLIMDITREGLRIQLVDDQNQPMFDLGKDAMNPAMKQVLEKITLLLKTSPNKISIQGHTDANPYDNPDELQISNWELSTQRANAARRALVEAGLDENKVLRVSGYGSTHLLDKQNPLSPKNRRITIIVMKKAAADSLLADE